MSRSDFELSRPVEVLSLPVNGLELTIEATEKERAAITKRLGLVALGDLRAALTIKRDKADEIVEVAGELSAQLTQQCVVTLEPVAETLKQSPVRGLFAPPKLAEQAGMIGDLPEEDLIEPIAPNGTIDVGELLVQHLATAINPYPRKPGVEFSVPKNGDGANVHQFAKLKDLKG